MRLVGLVGGILFLTVYNVVPAPSRSDNVIAISAASPNVGGQGVSGVAQKNATVKGSPRANPSINGSQTRSKH